MAPRVRRVNPIGGTTHFSHQEITRNFPTLTVMWQGCDRAYCLKCSADVSKRTVRKHRRCPKCNSDKLIPYNSQDGGVE